MTLCSREKTRQAFTLLEMLVVVTIIVLLLAFSTPALMRTMQSSRLASVGDTLMGSISEAQQVASAQGVPVELRFFSHANPEFVGTEPLFYSYQLFKITLTNDAAGGANAVQETLVPVGNLVRFPSGIAVASAPELSGALSGDGLPDTKDGSTPGYSGVEGATYKGLRFMTDGSCRAVGTTTNGFAQLEYKTLPTSFFTITYDNGQDITLSNLPKNFYTIQIDPFTGKARNYRPGF